MIPLNLHFNQKGFVKIDLGISGVNTADLAYIRLI